MKNTILGFLLAVILIIGTATTTVSVMTIKPAQPKEVFVEWYSFTTSLNQTIRQKTKEGFIVKSIVANSQKSEYVLVMEKY